MPYRFLHAADLHLDTPFASVGTTPPEVREALREASVRAWSNLVAAAIDQQVAFVVLAGDIYDGAERGLRAQRRFLQGLERLHEAGIRTFIAYGNHDPVNEGWSAIDELPSSVVTFPAAIPGQQAASTGFSAGGEPVTVTGISYATRATTENLVGRFPEPHGPGLHVAVLHANVGADADHAAYSPCTIADLRASGHQYWALGHVHRRTILSAGDPWIVYPGNLQGRSAKPAECEPKGAVLATVDGGRVNDTAFVPLDVVRFVDLSVDIEHHTLQSLLDVLEEHASPARHDGRSLIVRATITGSGSLHSELLSQERRAEVLDALRDRSHAEPFVWWDRLRWRTRPPTSYAKLAHGNDFVADLLALAASGSADAAPVEIPELPVELRRLLAQRADGAPAGAKGTDLLDRAARLAVDTVMEVAP
jgi:DNA repair exonuclease SbcCD nuclease subunit